MTGGQPAPPSLLFHGRVLFHQLIESLKLIIQYPCTVMTVLVYWDSGDSATGRYAGLHLISASLTLSQTQPVVASISSSDPVGLLA